MGSGDFSLLVAQSLAHASIYRLHLLLLLLLCLFDTQSYIVHTKLNVQSRFNHNNFAHHVRVSIPESKQDSKTESWQMCETEVKRERRESRKKFTDEHETVTGKTKPKKDMKKLKHRVMCLYLVLFTIWHRYR